MPIRTISAQRAPVTTRPPRSRRFTRFLPHLLAAFSIAVVVPFTVTPPPASAACGTNWQSRAKPPETVRVFRTASGRVDVVDFRTYVGNVMASGEWPTYLPTAVLEAGAVAVKQYAWYYALEGNHRPWYRTSSGICYDVMDNTNDQLFRPETAYVTTKQRKAISETWGLTLRKFGRFFLTGYRSGSYVGCGKDANGWKLYAKSAVRCARQGMDRQQIQEIYYKPHVKFVWRDAPPGGGDTQPPELSSGPQIGLREAGILGGRNITIDWQAAQDESGIARYQLQRSVDGGSWRDVRLAEATATQARAMLSRGSAFHFRVRAMDSAGNWSDYRNSPLIDASVVQPSADSFSGGWTRDPDSRASGGSTRYATQEGATATFTFTGRSIALIAPRGPDLGDARILINGSEVATIDLRASQKQSRRIVFSRDWTDSARRTVEVVVLGTGRVDVDAFLVLR